MRTVSASLEDFLDTTTAGTGSAHVVTVTPRVGSVVRWTDYSTDLVVGGNTYYRGGEGTTHPVIRWGTRTESVGTQIDRLDMTLMCGEAALFNGVRLPLAATQRALDGATVVVERVFGEDAIDVALGTMPVFYGIVAEARPSSTAVELDIECGLAALTTEIPRKLYKAGCTNILFDGQCGLSEATYTVTGTVGSGATTTSVPSDRTEANDYFNLGVMEFSGSTTTVALRNVSRAVRSYALSGGTFTPDRALPTAPVSGDTFTVYPGCRKNVTNPDGSDGDCVVKFASDNSARYRGFPSIPRKSRWISKTVEIPHGTRTLKMNIVEDSDTYGRPVPIVYGKNRVRAEVIDSLAGPVGIWTSLSALSEGPIAGVDTIYYDNKAEPLSAVHATVWTGTRPTQTIATKAIGYPGVAIVGQVVGSTTYDASQNYEFEVRGLLSGTGGTDDDADPASVIRDVLGCDPTTGEPKVDSGTGASTDPYGAQFPFVVDTDTGLDGTAASSYRRYVAQAGAWISPVFDDRVQAIDALDAELCEPTNAEPLWRSDGTLKIVPRADTTVGTFSPVTSVRYALDRDDLLSDGGDPVRLEVTPETDTYNLCPVTYRDRNPQGAVIDGTLAYSDATEEDPDPVDVALRGERPAAEVSYRSICLRDWALRLSRILAQRQVRARQTIEFALPWRFSRLEPCDLVTVTDEVFPFSLAPFQIREIEEDMETGVLTIRAQEWEGGVNHATAHTTQSSDGSLTQWPDYNAEARIHESSISNWTARTIPSGSYVAAAWGGNIAVAVGLSSVCATSADGITWTSRTIPAGSYRAVAWNGSQFVAVGDSSVCATSPDGITWTARTIPTGSYRALAWNETVWCAVGSAGVCATSPDGVTWTARTLPDTASQRGAIAWSGAVFCTATTDYSGRSETSPDGITWTARTMPFSIWNGLVWDGVVFVATGSSGACARSEDGVTWESLTIPTGSGGSLVYRVITFGPLLVAFDGDTSPPGRIAYSADYGSMWTLTEQLLPGAGYFGAATNGRFLILVGSSQCATSLAVR